MKSDVPNARLGPGKSLAQPWRFSDGSYRNAWPDCLPYGWTVIWAGDLNCLFSLRAADSLASLDAHYVLFTTAKLCRGQERTPL